MSAFLGPILRCGAIGAVFGGCLGAVSASLYRLPEEEIRIVYEHPVNGKTHAVDTLGLDKDMEVTIMVMRLGKLLQVDPTVNMSARAQFNVICHRLQRFYGLLKRYHSQPSCVRFRLELRETGTRLLTSLARMEEEVWSAREIEEIMRVVAFVQEVVTKTLLSTEK